MNPDPTVIESCRIIAEFEDDASSLGTAEPRYVPVMPPNWLPPFLGIDSPSVSPPAPGDDGARPSHP